MFKVVQGLIIREVEYKDSDKLLTVLTKSDGKITVLARGARRKNSKFSASTQILTYSELSLFENKDRYTLNDANVIEMFAGLRRDIEKMSLAMYFAQLLDVVGDEDVACPSLLTLGLNGIYALSNLNIEIDLVKAAFELKLMSIMGYEPQVSTCYSCGIKPQNPVFNVSLGSIMCNECRQDKKGLKIVADKSVIDAMNYVLLCDAKKLFNFRLKEKSLKLFCEICETYLITQLEVSLYTLDFYKSLKFSTGEIHNDETV